MSCVATDRKYVAVLVTGAGLAACCLDTAAGSGPDLARYDLVLEEEFTDPFHLDRGLYGPWSPTPRRAALSTNSPKSVFLSGEERDGSGAPIGLAPIWTSDGQLTIKAGRLPPEARDGLAHLLRAPGKVDVLKKVRYYTGMLATDQSWAQTYGYFEIVARVPRGKGHWPAFWLAPAGLGWPPELDVFEAYGEGLRRDTPKDDTFNVAVHFDAIDLDGQPTRDVNLTNPFDLDESGRPAPPRSARQGARDRFAFGKTFDAKMMGADIYGEFWTWAAEWTPERIVYYFGRTRDTLREIYAAPTPPDVTTPMYVIVNDQVGSSWGWDPVPAEADRFFAAANTFAVESISLYFPKPERALVGTGDGDVLVAGSGQLEIVGTAGDDRIVTGSELNLVKAGGGNDIVFVTRGTNNVIIEDFGCDDRLVLEGFVFGNGRETEARMRQVGEDTWLINGAYPADPQTIVLRKVPVGQVCPASIVSRWPETPDVWSSVRRDGRRKVPSADNKTVRADPLGSRLADGRRSGVHLIGSAIGDLYEVSRSETRIVELPVGGVDTTTATQSYTLPPEVENIVGADRSDLMLTGNDGDNRLAGGGDRATFVGAAGDDLIDLRAKGQRRRIVYDSGAGHDTVVGLRSGDVVTLRGVGIPDPAAAMTRLGRFGTDVVLDLGSGQSITLRDVAEDALTPETFVTDGKGAPPTGVGFDPFWRPNPEFAR